MRGSHTKCLQSIMAFGLVAGLTVTATAQEAAPAIDFDCSTVGTLWEDATKEELRDAKLHNRSTKLYFNQKLFDKAARSSELAVHLDDTEPEYFMRLGMAYAELGCDDAAGGAFARAASLSESDKHKKLREQNEQNRAYYWQDRFSKGVDQIDEGELERAAESFNAAIAIDSTDVRGWRNLGVVLMELEENVEAVGAFKTALDIEPDDERTREFYRISAAQLAIERFQDGKSASAEAETKESGMTKMNEAIEMFDGIMALDPPAGELSGYLGNVGIIWQSLGDAHGEGTPEAHEAYMKAVEMYRQSALKNYEAAAEEGETPLTLDTDTEFLGYAIGCFDRAGETDSTLAYARKLVDIAPDDSKGYRIVGAALQEKGETEEALAYFLMGQCLDPESGSVVPSVNDHFVSLMTKYQPSDDIIKASITNLESPEEIRVAVRDQDTSEAWIFWEKGHADCYYNGQFVGKVNFEERVAQ